MGPPVRAAQCNAGLCPNRTQHRRGAPVPGFSCPAHIACAAAIGFSPVRHLGDCGGGWPPDAHGFLPPKLLVSQGCAAHSVHIAMHSTLDRRRRVTAAARRPCHLCIPQSTGHIYIPKSTGHITAAPCSRAGPRLAAGGSAPVAARQHACACRAGAPELECAGGLLLIWTHRRPRLAPCRRHVCLRLRSKIPVPYVSHLVLLGSQRRPPSDASLPFCAAPPAPLLPCGHMRCVNARSGPPRGSSSAFPLCGAFRARLRIPKDWLLEAPCNLRLHLSVQGQPHGALPAAAGAVQG